MPMKNESLLAGPMPQKLPRRAKLVGVVVAALVLVPGSVRDADAGQEELPTFGDLPVGKVTAPPDNKEKPPTTIPASESVPGFRVLPAQYPNGPMQITSDQLAANYNPGAMGMPTVYDGVSGCYSQRFATALAAAMSPSSFPQNDIGGFAQSNSSRPFEWEQGLGWQVSIYNGAKMFSLVHSERVVNAESSKPTLESTDVWFDPSTKGFRLQSKASLPLRQVGTAPGGIRLFAGRDERSGGQQLVHFIVSRAKDTPYQQMASTMLSRGENTTAAGACGHHRISLLARKEGESGVVQLTTVLADLKPGEQSSAAPLAPLPPTSMAATKEIRTRQIRAQFSVSQTSRDKEPVLSVATSWAGPEILQRVFLPAPAATPVVSAPAPRVEPTPPPKTVKKSAPSPKKPPPPRIDSGF